ncbi:MAG: 3-deoxy-manno-octulosonate cytidylyltransferase [Okeania sp. SIO3B5]|uniref:3-deoxy-manno-octulosonate cytidylyltransferase n=1 Tax=Okeania sp. SIO3B5 TaxID=2607811 RepID=UPI0013FEB600|nr:3-deoxy-manno-octulosonate cytidylyltransferase [Okeania sp. SIO3B5]NEO55101.1 3-deoxy-manno-octulosonate cytidylyltransferase [Okeania sp. SIO3B5]
MSNPKSIVVIPARLASTRLPRKILADIGGHPMLWHVYQRCLQATKPSEIHVATDSEEIAEVVRSWGGNVWMTSPDCASGTERIVSIIDSLEADFIVNVQGDQPLLEPKVIDQTIETFENTHPLPDIVTPACLLSEKGVFDPNVVKMVKNHAGYAMYFSRNPIPYVRDVESEKWFESTKFWGHVGIYGYRRQVLEDYHTLPASDLESAEKLEQLRFLEAGKTIMTFVTDHHGISVDTQWQLDMVRERYGEVKS